MTAVVRLGMRANAGQFALLVGLNALVGALVGLERSVVPLIGERDFGLRSSSAILAFIVAFGAAKALTNLAAGELAERFGRKRLLVAGWLVVLPVPLLIGLAPSWWFIVAANLLLGTNQGLAWSMTVVMKIDLAGPKRRGLALGLNEAAGYLGVAAAAFATGALAASYAPRTVVWVGATLIAAVGLLLSVFAVRDTAAQVDLEQQGHPGGPAVGGGLRDAFARASLRDPVLRVCSQAGLFNNLNDALAWGLAPLYLAAHGASLRQIAIVAAAYPVVWGLGQLLTGWLSDHTGRKPLITAGMLMQAAALGLLVIGNGRFTPSLGAAILLGAGTALVYPTLIAAVSDLTQPRECARVIGVYRFWRDFGFVLGALIAGIGADATSARTAIVVVAALTGASGLLVAATSWQPRPQRRPEPEPVPSPKEGKAAMGNTLEATLPWWIAGPILGLVIATLLGVANKRFGVLGGVTDVVEGSPEGLGLRSWRTTPSTRRSEMKLRLAALGLGAVTGFVFGWARMTDPNTFHRMLSLDSPRIYLLMGAAVAVAFVGARLLRGRRALLTGETIGWNSSLPTRSHIVGSILFGIGWGISDACPGPTAAQLGAGRILALAVAAGVLAGVKLQPRLARAVEEARNTGKPPVAAVRAGDVL